MLFISWSLFGHTKAIKYDLIMRISIHKLIKLFGILAGVIILIYIIYPKENISLIKGSGWIFSDSAKICKCIGISKNITNSWLSEYYLGRQNINTINQNDYCVGVHYKCLVTNIKVDFDILFPDRN